MILLLDTGNSRLKWAMADGARLHQGAALLHHGAPEKLVRRLPGDAVTGIWIAQVLGAAQGRKLTDALRRRYGLAPRVARVQREALGLHVAYRRPERLGVDRWLSMLGLWTRLGRAFCVVSAGTALTFDAVDRNGRHLGGLIAPGLRAAEQAVRGSTRFHIAHRPPGYAHGLGRDTEACVRQGALHACAGLVERAARNAAGGRYLCGGDAGILRPHLGGRWNLRERAVLEGLHALARHGA